MRNAKSVWNLGAAMTIAGLLSVTASTLPASAAALLVNRSVTKAPGENTCLGFARDAATNQHLQNIQHNNGRVTGTKADKFAVLLCVGTTVIVSVVGNDAQDTKTLADALTAEIGRMIKID